MARDKSGKPNLAATRGRRSWRTGPSLPRPVIWVLAGVVAPLVPAAIIALASWQFAPAWSAAHGRGTLGYFVAEAEHCDKGACSWTGSFTLSDGRVTLRNASFVGPHGGLRRGARIPAIDSGGPDEVFARNDAGAWEDPLVGIVVGGVLFVLWLWLVPARALAAALRRRRAADSFMPRI